MTIEGRDGWFTSLIKSKDIQGTVFGGNRTWSVANDQGHFLSISTHEGQIQVEVVIPKSDHEIRYEKTRSSFGHESLIRCEEAEGEAINAAGKPWFGKIRFVSP